MPTVVRLTNASIGIFADDHAPQHFHLIGPDSNAMVKLGTMEVLRGIASRRDLAEAMAWAARNVGVLEAYWSRLNDLD